jgi:hypothetical protein
MSERLTYIDCLMQAARTPSLVAEFDRLTGHKLATVGKGTPLDQMIDDACGVHDAAMRDFCEFVWDCVYLRLPTGLTGLTPTPTASEPSEPGEQP